MSSQNTYGGGNYDGISPKRTEREIKIGIQFNGEPYAGKLARTVRREPNGVLLEVEESRNCESVGGPITMDSQLIEALKTREDFNNF